VYRQSAIKSSKRGRLPLLSARPTMLSLYSSFSFAVPDASVLCSGVTKNEKNVETEYTFCENFFLIAVRI